MQRDERMKVQVDPAEQARRALNHHEKVIENARRSFVALGQSLLAIRSERLYAGEFSTFAEYCEARWDISEAYANRVINAALVAIEATPIGVEINSEAVARELVGLTNEPEMLRQVWDEATRRAAGGRVTAALVKEVRKALEPPAAEALDGEVVDPLDAIPAAATAVNDFLNTQTSGLVDTSPVDESGEDHRVSDPGEADDAATSSDAQPPAASLGESVGDETGSEDDSADDTSGQVDEREQDGAGVSRPAPASDEEDEEQRTRREMRERMSVRFCESVVTLSQGIARRDPAKWLDEIYVPGAYKVGNLPRVPECFTPESLKELARQIYTLADHIQESGRQLP
jgi:hypothetical protein